MSTFGSSLGEKRRIIIRNPDGTLMHCYKSGERDSTYCPKKEKNNQNLVENPDNLSIADSELDYIVRHYEQFDNGNIIEEFLNIFKKNQIIFLIILSCELILSIFLAYQSYNRSDYCIRSFQKSHDYFSIETYKKIFFVIFYINIGINLAFYPFGYYAVISKKYKLVSVFSTFALITGIITVFFVFINLLFILLFIIRLILYTFSKFISSLLVSIIVLPRRMQHNQYDTIDNHDEEEA